jgi:hypothetical protein
MCNLHRRPSIVASYQVSVHLAKQFEKRIFFLNRPITIFSEQSTNICRIITCYERCINRVHLTFSLRSKSLCGNNFMNTIFKFLHSIMFTLTLQISKLTKAVALNSFPHWRFWQFVYKENVRLLLNCNIMLNNNKISGIYILTNPVIY